MPANPADDTVCPQCPTAAGVPLAPLVHRRWFVLLMLFAALGPLAFPLLWRSPQFSTAWKILLTIAVTLLTAAIVWLLWIQVGILVEAFRELSRTC
jgi:hypothetical protein